MRKFLFILVALAMLCGVAHAQRFSSGILFQNRPTFSPNRTGWLWRIDNDIVWSIGSSKNYLVHTTAPGGALDLNSLSDVDITTQADGDVLIYNGPANMWFNCPSSATIPDPLIINKIQVDTIEDKAGTGAPIFTYGGDFDAAITVDGEFTQQDLGGDPSTPASGYGAWYVKNDLPYFIDDGGTVYDLTGSGGGGFVTLTTAQTITGVKTFNADVQIQYPNVLQGLAPNDLLIKGPLSVQDSSGTTQIRVGSIPNFPNGFEAGSASATSQTTFFGNGDNGFTGGAVVEIEDISTSVNSYPFAFVKDGERITFQFTEFGAGTGQGIWRAPGSMSIQSPGASVTANASTVSINAPNGIALGNAATQLINVGGTPSGNAIFRSGFPGQYIGFGDNRVASVDTLGRMQEVSGRATWIAGYSSKEGVFRATGRAFDNRVGAVELQDDNTGGVESVFLFKREGELGVRILGSYPTDPDSEGTLLLTTTAAALGFVTTDTAQTISGHKTFTTLQSFNASIVSSGANDLVLQPANGQSLRLKDQAGVDQLVIASKPQMNNGWSLSNSGRTYQIERDATSTFVTHTLNERMDYVFPAFKQFNVYMGGTAVADRMFSVQDEYAEVRGQFVALGQTDLGTDGGFAGNVNLNSGGGVLNANGEAYFFDYVEFDEEVLSGGTEKFQFGDTGWVSRVEFDPNTKIFTWLSTSELNISAGATLNVSGTATSPGGSSGSANEFWGANAGDPASGSNNTGLGAQALANIDTGSANTAVGYQALDSNSFDGSNNVAVGSGALGAPTNSGSSNTGVGAEALAANTSGANNVAVGYQAADEVTGGSGNVAVGDNALSEIKTTSDNTAVGYFAGRNLTGSTNVAVGRNALNGGISASGSDNVALGAYALQAHTTGDNVVGLGRDAGYLNTTESDRVYIGGWNGSTQNPLDLWFETNAIADDMINVWINRDDRKLLLMDTDNTLDLPAGTVITIGGTEVTTGSPAGFVTTDTAQTISGHKTFTILQSFNASIVSSGANDLVLQPANGQVLRLKDQAGVDQITIASKPTFPNGLTANGTVTMTNATLNTGLSDSYFSLGVGSATNPSGTRFALTDSSVLSSNYVGLVGSFARSYTLGAFDATGPAFTFTDNTAGSGGCVEISKSSGTGAALTISSGDVDVNGNAILDVSEITGTPDFSEGLTALDPADGSPSIDAGADLDATVLNITPDVGRGIYVDHSVPVTANVTNPLVDVRRNATMGSFTYAAPLVRIEDKAPGAKTSTDALISMSADNAHNSGKNWLQFTAPSGQAATDDIINATVTGTGEVFAVAWDGTISVGGSPLPSPTDVMTLSTNQTCTSSKTFNLTQFFNTSIESSGANDLVLKPASGQTLRLQDAAGVDQITIASKPTFPNGFSTPDGVAGTFGPNLEVASTTIPGAATLKLLTAGIAYRLNDSDNNTLVQAQDVGATCEYDIAGLLRVTDYISAINSVYTTNVFADNIYDNDATGPVNFPGGLTDNGSTLVTLDTAQTITGTKTFNVTQSFNASTDPNSLSVVSANSGKAIIVSADTTTASDNLVEIAATGRTLTANWDGRLFDVFKSSNTVGSFGFTKPLARVWDNDPFSANDSGALFDLRWTNARTSGTRAMLEFTLPSAQTGTNGFFWRVGTDFGNTLTFEADMDGNIVTDGDLTAEGLNGNSGTDLFIQPATGQDINLNDEAGVTQMEVRDGEMRLSHKMTMGTTAIISRITGTGNAISVASTDQNAIFANCTSASFAAVAGQNNSGGRVFRGTASGANSEVFSGLVSNNGSYVFEAVASPRGGAFIMSQGGTLVENNVDFGCQLFRNSGLGSFAHTQPVMEIKEQFASSGTDANALLRLVVGTTAHNNGKEWLKLQAPSGQDGRDLGFVMNVTGTGDIYSVDWSGHTTQDGAVTMKDLGADPNTPASGYGTFYVKNDAPCFIDDSGTKTALGTGGVFGSQFSQGSSASQSSYTGTTNYQQKLRLTTASIPAGTYRVGWKFDRSSDNENSPMKFRVQVDDTTTIMEFTPVLKKKFADGSWTQTGGFAYVVLTAAAHNIDLDYGTTVGGSTVYIREAKLEIWRVQ